MTSFFQKARWGVVGLAAGCTQAAPPRTVAPDVLVTVHEGAITAPDTVAAGWRRVRVEEDSTPGRYLVGCVHRDADGRRHLARGENRMIVVPEGPADPAHAEAPAAPRTVTMVDFAYTGTDHWKAGPELIRIENAGRQDHQFRLVRLRDGASIKQWLAADDPDTVATPIVGLARTSAGQTAYLPVDLRPGSYVIYCLVPDAVSGKPHVMLGMLRAIEVTRDQ